MSKTVFVKYSGQTADLLTARAAELGWTPEQLLTWCAGETARLLEARRLVAPGTTPPPTHPDVRVRVWDADPTWQAGDRVWVRDPRDGAWRGGVVARPELANARWRYWVRPLGSPTSEPVPLTADVLATWDGADAGQRVWVQDEHGRWPGVLVGLADATGTARVQEDAADLRRGDEPRTFRRATSRLSRRD